MYLILGKFGYTSRAKKLITFGLKLVGQIGVQYKYVLNLSTSQGPIFRISQFPTELCSFTCCKMLFLATPLNLSLLAFLLHRLNFTLQWQWSLFIMIDTYVTNNIFAIFLQYHIQSGITSCIQLSTTVV